MPNKLCDINLIQSQIDQKYAKSKIKYVGGIPTLAGLNLYKIWHDKRHTDDVRVIRTYINIDVEVRGYDTCMLLTLKPNKCQSMNLKRSINYVTFDKLTPRKNNKQFAAKYKQINCGDVDQMYNIIDEMFSDVIKDYLENGE